MINLFDVIPSGFFNLLSSGSNNRSYADCLMIIYEQYEREISYKIKRNIIKDAISIYLLDNHVELEDESIGQNPNDKANYVIRKFCSKEIGWLEEESDDVTYEKNIIMTENGIRLAEFLLQLLKPEKEEFSSYIFNIYNTLQNKAQWQENPYVGAVKNIYNNAKALSKSLKRLSTFIKKNIETLVKEETLESLTENILEYCNGDFIKEYSRLIKQQNIHIYRTYIKNEIEKLLADQEIYDQILITCMKEEEVDEYEAEEKIFHMISSIKRFLTSDYDKIMGEIRHKITLYIQLAIGRARFLRNQEVDVRGSVEQMLKYMIHEMKDLGIEEELPEKMQELYSLTSYEFIDTDSIRFPRKQIHIESASVSEIEVLTEEEIERVRKIQEREAYNPYSKSLMKKYVEKLMENKIVLQAEEMPLHTKEELLATLSAVAYSQENGYRIEVKDGYIKTNGLLLKDFVIRRE